MKNHIRHTLYTLFLLSLLSCETHYGHIDSGLAQGKFDGNMYEYLHSNAYDWDSTLVLIDRAGLQDLFRGERNGYKEVTFFGPTNLSIIRWMIQQGYQSLEEVPVALCEELILRHVVSGIHLRDEIPRGETVLSQTQGTGGTVLTSARGTRFWIYSFREPYMDVPNAGPVVLYIRSLETTAAIDVASTNIETDTGVVHSLDYYYTLGQL